MPFSLENRCRAIARELSVRRAHYERSPYGGWCGRCDERYASVLPIRLLEFSLPKPAASERFESCACVCLNCFGTLGVPYARRTRETAEEVDPEIAPAPESDEAWVLMYRMLCTAMHVDGAKRHCPTCDAGRHATYEILADGVRGSGCMACGTDLSEPSDRMLVRIPRSACPNGYVMSMPHEGSTANIVAFMTEFASRRTPAVKKIEHVLEWMKQGSPQANYPLAWGMLTRDRRSFRFEQMRSSDLFPYAHGIPAFSDADSWIACSLVKYDCYHDRHPDRDLDDFHAYVLEWFDLACHALGFPNAMREANRRPVIEEGRLMVRLNPAERVLPAVAERAA